MSELDLGGARFDAITCLFDSIGYPHDERRPCRVALPAMRRHLADGGAVALEFLHAAAMLRHAAPVRVRRWRRRRRRR